MPRFPFVHGPPCIAFDPVPLTSHKKRKFSYEELEASGSFQALEELNPSSTSRATSGDMSTVLDTGYSSFGRLRLHHHNRDSRISSVTFQGETHAETETETETEPESEAGAGSFAANVGGITSASVSCALGAPAAAATTPPPTTKRSFLQAMLEESGLAVRAEGAEAQEERREARSHGADLAAVAAAAAAESWVEAWAAEEDEWIGRLAAADRTQSKSWLVVCSEASTSGGGGNASHSRPESLAHSLHGSTTHSRGASLRLHSRHGSMSHSRGGSLSLTRGASLWDTLGGSLPSGGSLLHSRGGSLAHSRGGSLAAEAGHGNSFVGKTLPMAPELVATEDQEVGGSERRK